MKRKKKLWVLGGTVTALTLVSLVAMGGDKGRPVQVATVGREDIRAKVSASGRIQAVKKVDISANVMGQVTRLAVKEGDTVKAGDFLLEIDPIRSRASVQSLEANYQATGHDLEVAKARLAQTRSDFQRADSNRTAGIISQSEFEQARTALATTEATVRAAQGRVDQARADLAAARDILSKSTITAPMDGVVTARQIERGETAVIGVQNSPGTVLLTISDMSKVEAEMEVDEASIPHVKLGQPAQVRIDAYPDDVFDAVVTEVGGSPSLKASQGTAIKFKVKVQIQNPPATIKPGLSAQADIFTGSRDKALAIPLQALVVKEEPAAQGGSPRKREGVFLMEAGKVRFAPIRTGLMGALNVEILEGLKGGETVVTGPFKALRELKGGEMVQPEAPAPAAKR